MEKYTLNDFDNFKKDIFGHKHCPSGDYTQVEFIPSHSYFDEGEYLFAPMTHFGNDCIFQPDIKFPHSCEFGGKCNFSARCTFDTQCVFNGPCFFQESCNFALLCKFAASCTFVDCSFNGTNGFSNDCKFIGCCTFGDYCTFCPNCDFSRDCTFGDNIQFVGTSIFDSSYKFTDFFKISCLQKLKFQADNSAIYFFLLKNGEIIAYYNRRVKFIADFQDFIEKRYNDDINDDTNRYKFFITAIELAKLRFAIQE